MNDLGTCPHCAGSGSSGHPDSGYQCQTCEGTGGVIEATYTAADLEAVVRAALEAAAELMDDRGERCRRSDADSEGQCFDGAEDIRALDPAAIVAAYKGDPDDR